MPSDKSGTIAPPVTALLAVSGATTPPMCPLPYLSFSSWVFSEFFACEYARKAAIGPPDPGIAPIDVPKPTHLNIKLKYFFKREKLGNLVCTAPML